MFEKYLDFFYTLQKIIKNKKCTRMHCKIACLLREGNKMHVDLQIIAKKAIGITKSLCISTEIILQRLNVLNIYTYQPVRSV